MKKWISTTIFILLVGYIVFAAIFLTGKTAEQVCKGIQLEILDSTELNFLTTNDILKMLKDNQLNPTGQSLDEINLQTIEKTLNASPIIYNSECYITIDGYLGIDVKCRRPIIRIIAENGDNYYLDEEGEVTNADQE